MIILINQYLNFKIFSCITFRIILSILTSFFINLYFIPYIIAYFKNLKKYQIIRMDGPKTHSCKKNTPTMGGLIILISILIGVFLYCDLCNFYIWCVIGVLIGCGIIGFLDDYKKINFKNTQGLKILSKFFWLSIVAIIMISMIYVNSNNSINIELVIPFYTKIFFKINYLYMFLCYFVIVGTSNAVNLTDGLDGLAIMPIIFLSVGLGIISLCSSNVFFAHYMNIPYLKKANELSILCAAITGSGLGFLWFNAYPAKIFMGDVGSLSLGGALGMISILLHQELLLLILGGIFVLEAISVILQVIYFKIRKKRIFKMAPIHHHYEIKGISESLIIVRFWILSFICLLIGIASLKVN
ncbi:phospho-N-acetylmuramoyl-pentapeptide-transferase [Buchnera aphidicola]|uniref:phospho-N-acetylmuramoyl-pentapeptide- transferase n=1 Tax=Buchnera aphidicola TaxID=9 RepID=UPI0034645A10